MEATPAENRVIREMLVEMKVCLYNLDHGIQYYEMRMNTRWS